MWWVPHLNKNKLEKKAFPMFAIHSGQNGYLFLGFLPGLFQQIVVIIIILMCFRDLIYLLKVLLYIYIDSMGSIC